MQKKLFSFIILFFLFTTNVFASQLNLESEKYILYNLKDNEVLLEKDSHVETNIASLTKMMTVIVAIENIEDFNEKVTITREMIKDIESDVAVAGFKVGNKVTYNDLLYASLLVSGADAVNALAYSISGSEKEFVKLMNLKAKELNLKNTNFTNVTGLYNSNHYSSAYDMAELLKYAIKNEKFKEVFQKDTYRTTNGLDFNSTRVSYSNFGVDMSNVTGSKTGYIKKAGYCLASTGIIEDIPFLLITLNAYDNSNGNPAINDTVHIYDYFEDNYSYKTIVNTEDSLYELDTIFAKEDKYDIVSPKEIVKYVKKDFKPEDIDIEYSGEKAVSSLMINNFKLGKVTIKYNDELIYEFDAKYDKSLNIDYVKLILEYKYYIAGAIVLLILVIIIKVNIKKKRRYALYGN